MYFSAFNVTVKYNNNSFSYIWVDGTTWTVNIPDSFLQVADINAFLHSVMYSNKHYLVSTTGDYIYLLEMVVNQARYAVQVNNYLISNIQYGLYSVFNESYYEYNKNDIETNMFLILETISLIMKL